MHSLYNFVGVVVVACLSSFVKAQFPFGVYYLPLLSVGDMTSVKLGVPGDCAMVSFKILKNGIEGSSTCFASWCGSDAPSGTFV